MEDRLREKMAPCASKDEFSGVLMVSVFGRPLVDGAGGESASSGPDASLIKVAQCSNCVEVSAADL
jgi:hypothetical protein